jgi:hypothetical protein
MTTFDDPFLGECLNNLTLFRCVASELFLECFFSFYQSLSTYLLNIHLLAASFAVASRSFPRYAPSKTLLKRSLT